MNISAQQVKKLRDATGVGMMECKQALTENQGDMDKAILWLRERGMSRAAKKAGRTAAEGMVEFAVSADGKEAVILELNCETDFASKNEAFRLLAKEAALAALKNKSADLESVKNLSLGSDTFNGKLTQLITQVGENMNLRRVQYVHVKDGYIGSYNHMHGKIGVLVVFNGEVNEKLKTAAVDVSMHIAASSPRFLRREEVSPLEFEQEQALARKKLMEEQSKKPPEMLEKILVGQMSKFFGEVCLLEQPFVKEPKMSVAEYLRQSEVKAQPSSFVRYQLGDGIEVKEENFADEVAAQVKKSL
ncbi:MAG: elongation factor Ts [Oligoflexales bacterium]|nr:elongation factor Ts [Oligoflexales bacterium]